jgi:hypothetical protein
VGTTAGAPFDWRQFPSDPHKLALYRLWSRQAWPEAYGLPSSPPVVVHLQPRRRGAGRPRAAATRSSARSGDPPGDDDPHLAAGPGWHWAHTYGRGERR